MTTKPKEYAKAKIYTKTGDQGSTRLVDGSCVEKFNPRVEAYGTVDELNSYLGVIRASLKPEVAGLDAVLAKVQNELFNIGSLLGCEDPGVLSKLPPIEEAHVHFLELQIDALSSELPELRNFILPAGDLSAAHLHVARTFCRRAERRSAEVGILPEPNPYRLTLMYLNRLSDYLFVAARWANLKTKQAEVLWQK